MGLPAFAVRGLTAFAVRGLTAFAVMGLTAFAVIVLAIARRQGAHYRCQVLKWVDILFLDGTRKFSGGLSVPGMHLRGLAIVECQMRPAV
ncbi:hypothetical protein, partial [Rhodocaloribacter sp.]